MINLVMKCLSFNFTFIIIKKSSRNDLITGLSCYINMKKNNLKASL